MPENQDADNLRSSGLQEGLRKLKERRLERNARLKELEAKRNAAKEEKASGGMWASTAGKPSAFSPKKRKPSNASCARYSRKPPTGSEDGLLHSKNPKDVSLAVNRLLWEHKYKVVSHTHMERGSPEEHREHSRAKERYENRVQMEKELPQAVSPTDYVDESAPVPEVAPHAEDANTVTEETVYVSAEDTEDEDEDEYLMF